MAQAFTKPVSQAPVSNNANSTNFFDDFTPSPPNIQKSSSLNVPQAQAQVPTHSHS